MGKYRYGSADISGDENASLNQGEPMAYDPEFRGPIRGRSCTDVIWLLLFIVFLGFWIYVSIWAVKHGNPELLLHPTDSEGNICGVPPLEDKPYLFFFDISKCATPTVLITGCKTPQVCVKKCPADTYNWNSLGKDENDLICEYGIEPNRDNRETLIKNESCASYYLNSMILSKRCIPVIYKDEFPGGEVIFGEASTRVQTREANKVTVAEVEEAVGYIGKLVNFHQIAEQVFEDFKATWWVILIGLTGTAVLSFIWILLVRCLAALMVYVSMLGALALLVYAFVYSYMRYVELENVPNSDRSLTEIAFTVNLDAYLQLQDTWLAFMIISGAVFLLLLLILVFLRTRIRIAIALIKQGSKAVNDMKSTLFFPVVTYVLSLLFVSWFIVVALHLISVSDTEYKVSGLNGTNIDKCSAGCKEYEDNDLCKPAEFKKACSCPANVDVIPKCMFYAYISDDTIFGFQAFNLFALFWGLFFATALGEMILAGAYASWYWTLYKKDLESFPLTNSVTRTLRYHVGTVAFGSLIVAIIRFIRVILEYIDAKLKKYPENAVVKAILCCCKCCFWCLEKFIRFINRNAFIMCAIHGKNFCNSAKDAFFLLARNVVRVVVLDKVTDFLLFLGRLVVVGGMTILSFYVFSGYWDELDEHIPATHNYLTPVITTLIGSYFVSTTFFNVYAMGVDTLFLCFLEDVERNDGSASKPYFMSKDLMKILGKKNKFPETAEE